MKTIRVWYVDLLSSMKLACYITNRNLTKEEWQRYMGYDVPYRKTCPNLPGPDEKEKKFSH